MMSRMAVHYSWISVTTPAPTVRPPSRIANRSSFSIAIGWISSIPTVTLSPGITISTPAGSHALARRVDPPDLDLSPHLPPPALPPPRHHRPPPRDRENVLDRHQKRLVHRPRRRRNVAVHRLHQLPDRLRRLRVLRLLVGLQRRPPDHRHLVPPKLVLLEKLTDLEFDQVENLGVVHHVHLVHEDDEKGN